MQHLDICLPTSEALSGAPNVNFRKISVRKTADLRSRIFGTFFGKILACLPLLGFSNVLKNGIIADF